MKVKAIKDGFYGGYRRRAGEVFEFEGKKPGKWMAPVSEAGKEDKAPPEQDDTPTTLSALGKKNTKRDAKAEGLV